MKTTSNNSIACIQGHWIFNKNFCKSSDLSFGILSIGDEVSSGKFKGYLLMISESGVVVADYELHLFITEQWKISNFNLGFSNKPKQYNCRFEPIAKKKTKSPIKMPFPNVLTAYMNPVLGRMEMIDNKKIYLGLYKDSSVDTKGFKRC
jgi:hypothetical protein